MKNYITLFLLIILIFNSCKKDDVFKKDSISLTYIVLDKSSNSFSQNGGREENYINIDTSYLSHFLDDLFYNNRRSDSNSIIILFFNYIDKNANGNKELFFKLPIIPTIDTVYKTEPGQILSSRETFEIELNKKKNEKEELLKEYKNRKKIILEKINDMLYKSKRTKGSDCSGTLIVADDKLNNYFIDTKKYIINKKLIIAFSDLVNYPPNNEVIELKNIVIRPGYTSKVPYIKEEKLKNLTTQDEFNEFIINFLGYN